MSTIRGTAVTNAIGAFFKILANFLELAKLFCEYNLHNPVLRVNGSINFDDLVAIIEASFYPEQFRRHNKSFIFF